jgi:hypothetical protein
MIKALMLLTLVVGIPYGMGVIGTTFDTPVSYACTFVGAMGINVLIGKWLSDE